MSVVRAGIHDENAEVRKSFQKAVNRSAAEGKLSGVTAPPVSGKRGLGLSNSKPRRALGNISNIQLELSSDQSSDNFVKKSLKQVVKVPENNITQVQEFDDADMLCSGIRDDDDEFFEAPMRRAEKKYAHHRIPFEVPRSSPYITGAERISALYLDDCFAQLDELCASAELVLPTQPVVLPDQDELPEI